MEPLRDGPPRLLARRNLEPGDADPGPLDGFDLHADVWVPPNDRARLEQLCRYLLRPPFAQDRLRLRADGRVVVELKKGWRDGASHLLFEPIEFLEKLAAITPRSAVNLLIYHGVLVPHARWRHQLVRYGRPVPDPDAHQGDAGPRSAGASPHSWAWATLMRRVFDLDVLACPRCGGRLRLIATVQDPGAVRTILAHLGLPLSPAPPRPGPTRAYRHRVAPRAGGAYGSSLSPGASRPPLTVRPSPEQAMIDGVR